MNSLRKIGAVDGFSGFSALDWVGHTASRLNLVYGWNRSGKTAVGRLLRILEPDTPIPDGFEEISFRLETDHGMVTESNRRGEAFRVRVFNEDFISENVSFADASAEPIVIVGKVGVDLEKEISGLEEEVAQLEANKDELESEISEIPNLEGILTDCARAVVENFSGTSLASGRYRGRSYDRRTVKNLIASANITGDTLENYILTDTTQRESLQEIIKGQYGDVAVAIPDLSVLERSLSAGNALLSKSIEATVIERLENDDALQEWIRVGYALHSDRGLEQCQFCGNEISQERLAKYGAYFTQEAAKAEEELSKQIDIIDGSLGSLNPELPDSSDLFADLRDPYAKHRKQAQTALEAVERTSKQLLERLKKRVGKMHLSKTRQQELSLPVNEIEKATTELSQIAAIFETQATRVAHAERERLAAATRIEKHIVSQILADRQYFENQSRKRRLSEKTAEISQKIIEQSNTLAGKYQRLRGTGIAIDEINQVIAQFLGPGEIELAAGNSDDSEELPRYRVLNQGVQSKYLSESEKSIVALAYFLTKLKEEGAKLEETVVVLDDPVDSQDLNFLFRTAGLLRRRLSGAGQLFILTHNFDLFNVLKDWMTSRTYYEEVALFQIEIERKQNGRRSVVSDLSNLLRHHKTEYQYLVGRLFEFAADSTALDAPLVPNIARKVIEYFATFKWCCRDSTQLSEIVHNRLITDEPSYENGVAYSVLKFVNEYSHGMDFSRRITASIMEADAICSNVLEFLKHADKVHYEELYEAVQEARQGSERVDSEG